MQLQYHQRKRQNSNMAERYNNSIFLIRIKSAKASRSDVTFSRAKRQWMVLWEKTEKNASRLWMVLSRKDLTAKITSIYENNMAYKLTT